MNITNLLKIISNGLEAYLGAPNRPCKVILSNMVSPLPNYPYVACTAIQPASEHGGTHGIRDDGTRIKQYDTTWSFTIQSDDVDECMELAIKMVQWFHVRGVVYLSDNGIAVKRVGAVTNRDNLISTFYEYRNGFDVTFTLLDVITDYDSDDYVSYIETADTKNVSG